jgi:hypothetical protein
MQRPLDINETQSASSETLQKRSPHGSSINGDGTIDLRYLIAKKGERQANPDLEAKWQRRIRAFQSDDGTLALREAGRYLVKHNQQHSPKINQYNAWRLLASTKGS